MEKFSQNKIEGKNNFEKTLDLLIKNTIVEMEPKEKLDFLNWAVREKNFLLHGSVNQNIRELVPRMANCQVKEFGNQKAVFANENPIVTMFYAIKNRDFDGVTSVSQSDNFDTGKVEYSFEFRGENVERENCISNGSIYLLERDGFEQGINQGEEIDEFIHKEEIKPIAEVEININDFPYLDDIKFIKEKYENL